MIVSGIDRTNEKELDRSVIGDNITGHYADVYDRSLHEAMDVSRNEVV
jgi:hypothetical protein